MSAGTLTRQGRTNCSNPDIQDHSLPCTAPPLAEINMPVGKRTRLRLINAGSNGMFRISIDQHPFELVEVDDTAVWGPSDLHEVSVTTGQRSSIVIEADQGEIGAAFYMRAYFVRGTCGEIHLAMWHAEERMSWVHCGPAGGSRNHPLCRLR